MELSNGAQTWSDQRRGQGFDNRKTYAWTAEATANESQHPVLPHQNGNSLNRRSQNWNGKDRVPAMRPPNRATTALRNGKQNNFRQPNEFNANIICYTCGEKGHMSPNFPKRLESKELRWFKHENCANPKANYGTNLAMHNPERSTQQNDWRRPMHMRKSAQQNNAPQHEHTNRPQAKAAMGAKPNFEKIPSREEYLGLTTVEIESFALSDAGSTMKHNDTENRNSDPIGTFEMHTSTATSFETSPSILDDKDQIPNTTYTPDENMNSESFPDHLDTIPKRLERIQLNVEKKNLFDNLTDCPKFHDENLYRCECLTKHTDPYLLSLEPMERVTASIELNIFEMDDTSDDDKYEEALCTLYDFDQMTQPNFNPNQTLARLDEQPKVMSQLDEDYIIQPYESGTLPNDLRLREDYLANMERRAEESTASSEHSTITAGTTTEEDIITYDE